jgi:uncharacterized protein YpmB
MEPEKKSHGALIGSIIIIIILIIGGIYIWQSKVKKAAEKVPEAPVPITSENTTDELNTLDQDINSLDTSTNVDTNSIQ